MEAAALQKRDRWYLRHLGKNWLAWLGVASLAVSAILLRWPRLLSDGVPWWGFFWVGALLVFWTQYRLWRKDTSVLESMVATLRQAVDGELPLVGEGLEYVNHACVPCETPDGVISPLLAQCGIFSVGAYLSKIWLRATKDIDAPIVGFCNRTVQPGLGKCRIEPKDRMFLSVAKRRQHRGCLYSFAQTLSGKPIPAGAVLELAAYSEETDTFFVSVHIEAADSRA